MSELCVFVTKVTVCGCETTDAGLDTREELNRQVNLYLQVTKQGLNRLNKKKGKEQHRTIRWRMIGKARNGFGRN